jgi:glycosyltransferase involved in cell wall biosynthesis
VVLRVLLIMEEVKCGGAELSFFALCRALSQRCEAHLALYQGSLRNPSLRRLCDALVDTSVKVHPFDVPLNPGTFTNLHRRLRRSASSELASLIEAIRPDAILVNLPTVERGQAVVDAADLVTPRPPVWGFLHSANRPSLISAKLGRFRNLMVPGLLRRFDRLLTVSAAGAQEISVRYRMSPPDILHPPIALPRRSGSERERSARRVAAGLPETFLLGIVGRVHADKGQDAAVRITARLLDAGLPLHLVVIGDGPNLAAIQHLARQLRIVDKVSFLGWRQDADELIPLLSAVIMPSKHEGMPLTALQAAGARVPVLGYAVDGLTELLPEGFKVPCGDEAALADVVAALIGGAKVWPREEMGQRAQEWSDPDDAAARLLSMLQSALSGKRPAKSDNSLAHP